MWDALQPLRLPDQVAECFEGIDLTHLFEHLSDALSAGRNDEVTRTRTLADWRPTLRARHTGIDADRQRDFAGFFDSPRRAVTE